MSNCFVLMLLYRASSANCPPCAVALASAELMLAAKVGVAITGALRTVVMLGEQQSRPDGAYFDRGVLPL